jgi:hypothetical protein
MAQLAAAVVHDGWSEKGGRGFEHHEPHLYSQVGVGDTVTVEVHRDTLFVDVVDVVDVVGGQEEVVEVVEVWSSVSLHFKQGLEREVHTVDVVLVVGVVLVVQVVEVCND